MAFSELEFEWDAAKAAINLQKHGITFEEAAEVFLDPNCVNVQVKLMGEELRYATIWCGN